MIKKQVKFTPPPRPKQIKVASVSLPKKPSVTPKAPGKPGFLARVKAGAKKVGKKLMTDNHSKNYTRVGADLYRIKK